MEESIIISTLVYFTGAGFVFTLFEYQFRNTIFIVCQPRWIYLFFHDATIEKYKLKFRSDPHRIAVPKLIRYLVYNLECNK